LDSVEGDSSLRIEMTASKSNGGPAIRLMPEQPGRKHVAPYGPYRTLPSHYERRTFAQRDFGRSDDVVAAGPCKWYAVSFAPIFETREAGSAGAIAGFENLAAQPATPPNRDG